MFEMLNKKIWANFQRIIGLFTQKIVTKLSKIWVWDPGSGKNLLRIPNPGVKKAPDPGSGSATLHVRRSMLRFFIHCQMLIMSLSYLRTVFVSLDTGYEFLQPFSAPHETGLVRIVSLSGMGSNL
jgi:hypothetical protein